jgi:hypothetical protein
MAKVPQSDNYFNGGKLYHVNQTRPGERPGSLVYTEEFTSTTAQESLEKGEKQLKVDGECSALHRERTPSGWEWVFYCRQDNYKGDGATVDLPDGQQPAHYDQGGKEHNYCWLRVDKEWVTGKGKKRSSPGPDTYDAIAMGVKLGLIPDPASKDAPEWITCEWVGTKHQSNMDGVPYEHALIPHMFPFVPQLHFETLTEFKSLVASQCFEGVVLIHSNGTRFKMRSDMTGIENEWDKNHRKKPADPGVTTIRPQVLTKDGLLKWVEGKWTI